MVPLWLQWARRLQAISQIGLSFSKEPYDRQRYEQIREIAAEMVAKQANLPLENVSHLFKSEQGYASPKVEVRGIVIEDEKIMLVRERADGCWTPPGGWADVGCSPKESVIKEIHEEAGCEARVKRLLAVYDINLHDHPPQLPHTYKLFFHCEILSRGEIDSIETDAVKFFASDQLPKLSAPRVTAQQVRRMFALAKDESLPTEVD